MDFKHRCFLYVAEELNITRAAKRLFISQQCLSHHIQRLEQEYGVALFNRKPSLSLTPFGLLLVGTFRQIDTLEQNLHAQISDLSNGVHGSILLGAHNVRALLYVPELMTAFHAMYPDVRITVVNGLSHELEPQVLTGALDLFIGMNIQAHDALTIIPLCNEEMLLVITDELMERYCTQWYPACREDINRGVNLQLLSNAPFIINS